eukprot:gene16622-22869_t
MLYRRSTVPDAPSVRHKPARPALRPSRAYARVNWRVPVSARPSHTAYALGADIANAESSCQPAFQRAELASLRSTLAEQVEGSDAPRVENSQPVVVLAAAVVLSLVTRIPDWQQDLSNMDANNAVVSFLEEKERQAQPLSLLPFLILLAAKAVLNSSRPREHKLRSTLRLRYRLVNWAYLHHASTYTAGEFKVNLVPALWAAAGELDPWFKTPKAASMIRSPELRSQLWPADTAAQILHAYMPIIISLLNAQAVCKFRDRVQVIPASQAATKREDKRNSAKCRVVHRDPAVRKVAGRRAAHRSTSTRVRFLLPRLCSLSKVAWRHRREAAPQSRASNRMVSILQLVDALNIAIESSAGEAKGVDVAEEPADGIIVDSMTVGATSGGGGTAASIRDVAATVSTLEANVGADVRLEEDVAALGSTLEVGTGESAAAVEDVAAMGSNLEGAKGASAAAVEDSAATVSTLEVGTGAIAAAVEDSAATVSTLEVGTGASAAAVEDSAATVSTLEVGTGASAAAVEDSAATVSTLEVGTGASAAAVEDSAATVSTLEVGTGASAAAVEDSAATVSTLEVGTGASAAAVEDSAATVSTLEVGTGASATTVEDVSGCDSALEVNAASSRENQTMKPGLPIADSDHAEDEVPAHYLQHYDIPIPTLEKYGTTEDLLPLLVKIAALITAVSGNIQPSEHVKEVPFRAPLDERERQGQSILQGLLDTTSANLHALRSPSGQQFVTCLDVNTRYFISQKIVRSVEPHLVALQDVALLLDPTDDALSYLMEQADPSEAASAITRYDGGNADDHNTTGACRTAALSARAAILHLLVNNAPVLFGQDLWEELAVCLHNDVRYVVSQLILQSTEPPLIALRPILLRLYPSVNRLALYVPSWSPPSPDMILHCWQIEALADWDGKDDRFPAIILTRYSEETQKVVLKDKRAILMIVLLLREPNSRSFPLAFDYLLYFCPGAAKCYSLPSGSPKLKLPQVSVSGNYIRLEDWPYVVTKFLQCIVQLQAEKLLLDQWGRMNKSRFKTSQNAKASKFQSHLEIVLCLAMDYSYPEGAQTQEAGASTFVRQVVGLVAMGRLSHAALQLLAKTITASSRPQLVALWPMAWELDPTKDMAKHVLLSFPSSSSLALLQVRSILDKAAAEHWFDVTGVAMSALQSLDREK